MRLSGLHEAASKIKNSKDIGTHQLGEARAPVAQAASALEW